VITTAEIPPGGEGEIKATLDTRGRKGLLSKSIRVTSNDPQNPASKITMIAYVELDFEFEALSLYMGKVPKGDGTIKRAFIRVKDPDEVKVVRITTSSPYLTARQVERSPEDTDRSRIEIEVTLLPGFPVGQIKETLTVFSNLERKPEARLRITGTIHEGIEINPDALDFLMTGTGNMARKSTKICVINNYRQGQPLEILRVRDLDGYLDLELMTLEEGRRFKLKASLKSTEAPEGGQLSGSIVINTNAPDHKEIKIVYNAVWSE
jgi:hypothetical protein